MKQRLFRQFGIGLFTFWFIQTALFLLVHLIPGDPVCAVYGEDCNRLDPDTRAQILAERGLDQPLYKQYANYFIDLAHFELGYSYIYRESVRDIIAYRLPRTLLVTSVDDPQRDETKAFAKKLRAAGVPAEVEVLATPTGWP